MSIFCFRGKNTKKMVGDSSENRGKGAGERKKSKKVGEMFGALKTLLYFCTRNSAAGRSTIVGST